MSLYVFSSPPSHSKNNETRGKYIITTIGFRSFFRALGEVILKEFCLRLLIYKHKICLHEHRGKENRDGWETKKKCVLIKEMCRAHHNNSITDYYEWAIDKYFLLFFSFLDRYTHLPLEGQSNDDNSQIATEH